LQAVYEATGKKPAELDTGEFPQELAYIMDIYHQLRSSEAIKHSEILAYCQLTNIALFAREIELIKMLDAVYWSNI
jgi:hypothetical protein